MFVRAGSGGSFSTWPSVLSSWVDVADEKARRREGSGQEEEEEADGEDRAVLNYTQMSSGVVFENTAGYATAWRLTRSTYSVLVAAILR